MRNWLATGAMVVIVAVSFGHPSKGASENKDASAIRAQSQGQDSQKPPPVIVQVDTQPPNAPDTNEEKDTQRKLAVYTFWLVFFTAVLGGVSIVQGYFLRQQARHLETHGIELHTLAGAARDNADAAKALSETASAQMLVMQRQLAQIEKQAQLQTAGMQQWVYLTNWRVKKLKNDPSKLRITVDLVNQSGLPLTLSEGWLRIGEAGEYTEYRIGADTFLPPNTPTQIEMVMAAIPEELSQFEQGSLSIPVVGAFSHSDQISGKRIDQSVTGWLNCGNWGTLFHWELHMNPKQEESQKNEPGGQ